MLKQQQGQLVDALRTCYQRMLNYDVWEGPPLENALDGFPITHDILKHLGVLKIDNTDAYEPFRDDLDELQQRSQQRSILKQEPQSPLPDMAATILASKGIVINQTSSSNEAFFPLSQFPPTPDQSPTETTSATWNMHFSRDIPMDMKFSPASDNWAPMEETACCTDLLTFQESPKITSYNDLESMEQVPGSGVSFSPFNFNDDGLEDRGLNYNPNVMMAL